MAELVVLNGAGAVARSVISSHLLKNAGKYASVKLVDARPYRKSVYAWQETLVGVNLDKQLARTGQSIDLALEGATDVVYFTHDYTTMASDKNQHLNAVAGLTKRHGIKNLVAVCPIELDLAWSEDEKNYFDKAQEAQEKALQTNGNLTLFRTNLTFGPATHLLHYITQSALVGKCGYANLVPKESKFMYAPIHTDDVAQAVGSALNGTTSGAYTLAGSEQATLRQIVDLIEEATGRGAGATGGSAFTLDYIYDFLYGTTPDLNMSRIAEFYESDLSLSNQLGTNTWHEAPEVNMSTFYKQANISSEDVEFPDMSSYKGLHLD